MKKFVLLTLCAFASTSTAQAVTIKEDSTWCVSRKVAQHYDEVKHLEDTTFVQRILDRANCVERKKPVSGVVLASDSQYTKLEITDGVQVWVRTDRVEK